jgi:hypothetical protein
VTKGTFNGASASAPPAPKPAPAAADRVKPKSPAPAKSTPAAKPVVQRKVVGGAGRSTAVAKVSELGADWQEF